MKGQSDREGREVEVDSQSRGHVRVRGILEVTDGKESERESDR